MRSSLLVLIALCSLCFIADASTLEQLAYLPDLAATNSFAIIDANHDSLVEIFLQCERYQPYPWSVWENFGDTNYIYSILTKPDSSTPWVAGDIDQDGLTDIVAWGHVNNVGCLMVYESPDSFSYPNKLVWYEPMYIGQDIFLSDLDQDGKKEILVRGGPTGSERNTTIYECRGDNDYQKVFSEAPPTATYVGGIACGDWDGDGLMEFSFASMTSTDTYALTAEVYTYECTGDDSYQLVAVDTVNTKNAYLAAAGNDMDGNGRKEFVIGGQRAVPYPKWDFKLTVFEATADNTYERMWSASLPNYSPLWSGLDMKTSDIDGDGKYEIVACTGESLLVYKAESARNYQQIIGKMTGNGDWSQRLTDAYIQMYDINKNGRDEVVVCGIYKDVYANLFYQTRVYEFTPHTHDVMATGIITPAPGVTNDTLAGKFSSALAFAGEQSDYLQTTSQAEGVGRKSQYPLLTDRSKQGIAAPEPKAVILAGQALAPSVWVYNCGLNAESFDVTCAVDSAGVVIYTNTQTVTSLGSYKFSQVNFAPWTPGPYTSTYDFKFYTQLTGDENRLDDTLTRRVYSLAKTIAAPYAATSPSIDGAISNGEWQDASMTDISNILYMGYRASTSIWSWGDAFLYAKHDSSFLYLAVDCKIDSPSSYIGDWNILDILLDDDHDHLHPYWPDSSHFCYTLEQEFDGSSQSLTGHYINIDSGSTYIGLVPLSGCIGYASLHPQYELAIPFGSAPLEIDAFIGDTVGFYITAYDGLNAKPISTNTWWPQNAPLTNYINSSFGAVCFDPAYYGDLVITGEPLGMEEQNKPSASAPYKFLLYQNEPNPFKQTTRINYQISAPGTVSVKVYNTLGQVVKTLANLSQSPGRYSVKWDGRDESGRPMAAGIYFCRLTSGGFNSTRKMVFLK